MDKFEEGGEEELFVFLLFNTEEELFPDDAKVSEKFSETDEEGTEDTIPREMEGVRVEDENEEFKFEFVVVARMVGVEKEEEKEEEEEGVEEKVAEDELAKGGRGGRGLFNCDL